MLDHADHGFRHCPCPPDCRCELWRVGLAWYGLKVVLGAAKENFAGNIGGSVHVVGVVRLLISDGCIAATLAGLSAVPRIASSAVLSSSQP